MTTRKTTDTDHALEHELAELDDRAHLADLERGPAAPDDDIPTVATEDTWIPRPDLGPNFTTYVPAGHPIPRPDR
jgi:hypothetical protein